MVLIISSASTVALKMIMVLITSSANAVALQNQNHSTKGTVFNSIAVFDPLKIASGGDGQSLAKTAS